MWGGVWGMALHHEPHGLVCGLTVPENVHVGCRDRSRPTVSCTQDKHGAKLTSVSGHYPLVGMDPHFVPSNLSSHRTCLDCNITKTKVRSFILHKSYEQSVFQQTADFFYKK